MKFGTILFVLVVVAAAYFIGLSRGKKACRADYIPMIEYRDTCRTVIMQDSVVSQPVVVEGKTVKQRVLPKRVTVVDADSITSVVNVIPDSGVVTPSIVTKLYEYSYESDLLDINEYVMSTGAVVAFERTLKLDTLQLEKRFTNTIVTTVTQPVIIKDYPTRIGIMGTVDTKAAFGVGAYSIFPQGQTVGLSYNITNKAIMLNAGVPIFNIKKRK